MIPVQRTAGCSSPIRDHCSGCSLRKPIHELPAIVTQFQTFLSKPGHTVESRMENHQTSNTGKVTQPSCCSWHTWRSICSDIPNRHESLRIADKIKWIWPQVTHGSELARLLKAEAMQPPGAGAGRQSWPNYDQEAPPVHLPVEKDAVRLQARYRIHTARRARSERLAYLVAHTPRPHRRDFLAPSQSSSLPAFVCT